MQPVPNPEIFSTGSIDLTQINRPETLPETHNEDLKLNEKSESAKLPEEEKGDDGE